MKKLITIILIILSLLNISFIWSNSMLNSDESYLRSDAIKDIVIDIIQPTDNNDDNSEEADNIENAILSKLVRKFAHFFEFMTLGLLLFLIKLLNGKPQLFTICFICLATAVIDEYIQSFFNRTDSISDVLIDFSGSITGIVLVLIVYLLYKKIKKHKYN